MIRALGLGGSSGQLPLNCVGFGIDILRCEAQRFGSNRWSAAFALDASLAASEPPSMDFLRMSLRRPALYPAATEVRIDGFRLAPPSGVARERLASCLTALRR